METPLRRTFAPTLIALLSVACSDGSSSSNPGPPLVVPVFAPTQGELAFPNDLAFANSEDRTLALAVTNPADLSDPRAAFSRLDGWSTTAPITIPFSAELDASSLVPGVGVRIFEVTTDTTVVPVGGAVTGVVRELAATDFLVRLAGEDPTGSTLKILFAQPLAAATPHLLVLTNELRDALGRPVGEDEEYDLSSSSVILPAANPLSGVQELTLAMEAAAVTAGVPSDSIVLTTSFTTQSVGASLQALVQIANQGDVAEQAVIDGLCNSGNVICPDTLREIGDASITLDGFLGRTDAFVPASPGFGDVYVGGLSLPYFLTAADNPSATQAVSDTTPLETPWRSRFAFDTPSGSDLERNVTGTNLLPARTGTEEVPLIIITPNNGSPAPWPVVLYQHGLSGDRTNALLVADVLCVAGFAVVAIDLPLHGIVDETNPFFEGYQSGGRRERTFGLDLVDNLVGLPTPDGIADPSGTHVFNTRNLLVTRDNLRQAVVDLAFLRSALGDVDVDLDASDDLDPNDVYFVGHSLGAIVGIPYLAQERVEAATLAAPGGGLPRTLINSPSFGPPLLAGLAAEGLLPGTAEFETWLYLAQSLLDGIDPVNYAGAAATAGNPIHLIEIVGGGLGGSLPDQVVPNEVPGFPLTGTEGLIASMGLSPLVGTTAGAPVQGAARFLVGGHLSLLDPSQSSAAFAEMQAQMSSFLQSRGTILTVFDASLLRP